MADKEKKEEKVEKVEKVGAPKEQKLKWTMARCRKVANRFNNEAEWKKGAPSSYKAAFARGWHKEIAANLQSRGGKSDKPMKKAA